MKKKQRVKNMAVTGKEYEKMAQKAAPPSHMVKNFFMAYLVGGLICTFGELLFTLYSYWGAEEKQARMAVFRYYHIHNRIFNRNRRFR